MPDRTLDELAEAVGFPRMNYGRSLRNHVRGLVHQLVTQGWSRSTAVDTGCRSVAAAPSQKSAERSGPGYDDVGWLLASSSSF